MLLENTLEYIAIGFVLGLSAGIAPGPLLTLVIAQTLRYNRSEGIKVAFSPLLTDIPIVLAAFWLYTHLLNFNAAVAIISFAGAFFVAYLGLKSLQTKAVETGVWHQQKHSVWRAVLANLLNPHPYLFWVTIGAPLIVQSLQHSWATMVAFLFSFYLMLVGSKVVVAMVIARTKTFINTNRYVFLMRILGATLLVFALMFFYDGLKLLF